MAENEVSITPLRGHPYFPSSEEYKNFQILKVIEKSFDTEHPEIKGLFLKACAKRRKIDRENQETNEIILRQNSMKMVKPSEYNEMKEIYDLFKNGKLVKA